MSGTPRIAKGVVAAPGLRRTTGVWQLHVVELDRVDPVTTEVVRVRAAYHHDCRT